jgi:hypothetical protein
MNTHFPPTRTRKTRAERLAYVRQCLEAVENYKGPTNQLARQTGLRRRILRRGDALIKSGDAKLLNEVRNGDILLRHAYRKLRRRAKISAGQKARWAQRTPEQRAAHGAKMRAAKLAKAQKSKKPS